MANQSENRVLNFGESFRELVQWGNLTYKVDDSLYPLCPLIYVSLATTIVSLFCIRKPGFFITILYIDNFTRKIPHVLFWNLKTLCHKSKHLKSLIVKLVIADMFIDGSGFSLAHDSNQLTQKEAVHYLRNDISCMTKMTCSTGLYAYVPKYTPVQKWLVMTFYLHWWCQLILPARVWQQNILSNVLSVLKLKPCPSMNILSFYWLYL